jgi:hypothetical protein
VDHRAQMVRCASSSGPEMPRYSAGANSLIWAYLPSNSSHTALLHTHINGTQEVPTMSQISSSAPIRPVDDMELSTLTAFATMHLDWFAEAHRDGSQVVVSVNARDPGRALRELVASDDMLDRQFVAAVRTLTGREISELFGRSANRTDTPH